MSTQTDIQKLTATVLKLHPEQARLSPSHFYQSLPLALADAVFSIGVRYVQCQNAVAHFARRFGWKLYRPLNSPFPPPAEQHTVRELLEVFATTEDPAVDLFNNRGLANPSSRSSIKKAFLLLEVARVLDRHGIQFLQDFHAYPNPTVIDTELNLLPAMSSGIIVNYIRLLVGDATSVKADRMILRFVHEATGRWVAPSEAIDLVRSTATALVDLGHANVNARLVDHLIWSHQRTLALPAKKKKVAHPSVAQPNLQPVLLLSATGTKTPPPLPILVELDFERFWDRCRTGGTTGPVEFGVDEDERLWIKSANASRHANPETVYRIKRSTVRTYLPKVQERGFRANHGWFCKLHDHILLRLGDLAPA